MRITVAFLLLCVWAPHANGNDARPTVFHVTNRVALGHADRVGLNLGLWSSWGAEQLSANVLKNPGFEGIVDRAIVIVSDAGSNEFTDDTTWLSREEGHWKGAYFEVLTGKLQGFHGNILHSDKKSGKGHFTTSESVAGLTSGDAISVTKIDDAQPPTQWWFEGGKAASDTSNRRPGSPGMKSLRLEANAAAVSYLDTIGDRAGKLLPLNGDWTLSVWAQAANPGTTLHVRLRRTGTPSFFDQDVALSTDWKRYSWAIQPKDRGPAGTLELRFTDEDKRDPIWLDDAVLARSVPDPSGFRAEVIETLTTLHPGYLRDWQGQLGDTFENRIAPAFARRATRYRPGGAEASSFAYGLPDFLQLAQEVDATPWVVLSPGMSSEEWRRAGSYLRQQADLHGFREILVEFGNENWNSLFRAAGIQDQKTLNSAAAHAFAELQAGSKQDSRLRPVIGGHFFNPDLAKSLAASGPHGAITAFAPYWAFDPVDTAALFPEANVTELGSLSSVRETAIYEMNAHSLNGTRSPEAVNQLVESPAAGTAIAWNSIGALNAGVRRICIYTLAGFDTPGAGKSRLIRLFGITKNLAEANNYRPEGEALALLNRAVKGDLHEIQSPNSAVRVAVFHSATGWRVAAASSSGNSEQIRIEFPKTTTSLPGRVIASNKGKAQMKLENNFLDLTLPPYGFAVVLPGKEAR